MQQIDMSGNLPMRCVANLPRVRYSAAYSKGRELMKIATVSLYYVKGVSYAPITSWKTCGNLHKGCSAER